MTHNSSVKIIAIVGLAGSGKSTAVEHLTKKGYPKVYFGGIIYKAAREAGIEPGDWEAEKQFRIAIREREGKDFVVKRAIQETRNLINAGQRRIVLDGLYTWTEYKLLKREFPGEITVIAVVTPKSQRKQRMAKRPERPMTSSEVDERDWSEIENLEKGGPIAMADHFIVNNHGLDDLNEHIDAIVKKVGF